MKYMILVLVSMVATTSFAQAGTSLETCVGSALQSNYVYQNPLVILAKFLMVKNYHLGASKLSPPTLSPGDIAFGKEQVSKKTGACLEAAYPFVTIQSAIIAWANQGDPSAATPEALKDLGAVLNDFASEVNNSPVTTTPALDQILTESGLAEAIKGGQFASVDDPALADLVQTVVTRVVAPNQSAALVISTLNYFSQLTVPAMQATPSWNEAVAATLN